MRWDSEQKKLHLERFCKFVPPQVETYVRPPSAGLKSSKQKKSRRDDKEVEIFSDRVQPLYVATNSEGEAEDLAFLDPYRTRTTKYMMVHRSDFKNCPKGVKRCQSCRIQFDNSDAVLIRSTGTRDETCAKTGKPMKKVGNVYFHNLVKCLTEHDKNFKYSDVIVLKTTYEKLSGERGKEVVEKQNMIVEQ